MSRSLRRVARLTAATPLAFLFVIAVRLIRPILCVRIGAMKSDRIGHFALETELTLLEQQTGIVPCPPRSFDIWYAPEPISNRVLYEMWKRVMRIWPNWFMVPVFRINNILPGLSRHQIATATASVNDVHNLLDKTPPHLTFTSAEEDLGWSVLAKMGIPRGAKFVAVILRDNTYMRSTFPDRDLSYHDYRNSDINDLEVGAILLAERGYFVLRMGSIVEKRFDCSHPKVVDYANTEFQSEFMDIFIGANCLFCVSDGGGYCSVPAVFRRPNVYVNFAPFALFYTGRSCDIGLLQRVVDRKTGRVLSLNEMFDRDAVGLTSSAQFDRRELTPLNNSPDEIADLIAEVIDRIEGKWQSRQEDEQDQNGFWAEYARVLGSKRDQVHGEFRSRIGSQFLRKNRQWWQGSST